MGAQCQKRLASMQKMPFRLYMETQFKESRCGCSSHQLLIKHEDHTISEACFAQHYASQATCSCLI